MRNIQSFIDEFGFIVHKDKNKGNDAGDSLQRVNMVLFAEYVTGQKFLSTIAAYYLKLVQLESGEIIRHPDSDHWWGQPGTGSGDQVLGWIINNGLYGNRAAELGENYELYFESLRKLTWALIKRGGFLWNTKHIWDTEGWKIPDHLAPRGISALIRAWMIILRHIAPRNPLTLIPYIAFEIAMLPILWACDLFQMLNGIFLCVMGYFNPDHVGDDLNFQLNLFFNIQHFKETKYPIIPIPHITKWIYFKFRPRAGLKKDMLLKGSGPQTAIDHYFMDYPHKADIPPPIGDIWKLVIKKI